MTQKSAILEGLRRGEHLTPLNALIRYHTMALSQRIGELKRDGHPIQSRMVTIGEKRVAEYYIENPAPGVPKPQGPDGHSSTASTPALDLSA